MNNLRKIVLGLFVGATALGTASPVIASTTTTIVSGTSITVSCTDSLIATQVCGGFTGGSLVTSGNMITGGTQASLSSTFADLYDLPNSSEATEAQALDILIDGVDDDDWVGTDGAKTDAGGVDSLSFSSDAAYIAFKIGNASSDGKTFFLSLISSGTINIAFEKNGQNGGGFSHYTEFGSVSAVPAPAAIWLFGTALIGFIGFSRRTKV